MKKFIVLAVVSLMTALGAQAQYRGSYNTGGHIYPSRNRGYELGRYSYGWNRPYFGLRVGPTFSNITGDDFSGGDTKVGVNVGMAVGIPLSNHMPLYLETGLYYTEKGEKDTHNGLKYNLDYLELPFVFKYRCDVTNHFAVEPYIGGYAAVGVAGKTRTTDGTRSTWNSFGDQGVFRRGDAGIKFGCGVAYDMFYADMTYEWGLANITHDALYDGRNGAFMINVGVNF